MANVTMSKDLEVYTDANDPTEPGDIKIVRIVGLEIDDCDALTQWSVHSGAGVTIELDTVNVAEGTGSVKVTVPNGITAVIKCTKSAGSWDFSSYKSLKLKLRRAFNISSSFDLFFGEANYDEQTENILLVPVFGWGAISWDISGIAAADRNAVTMFSVSATSSGDVQNVFWIDYVFADVGENTLIEGFDGERICHLYPKVRIGTYNGDGNDDRIVDLERCGFPSAIFLQKAEVGESSNNQMVFWTSAVAAFYSLLVGGGTAPQLDCIKGVFDGYFTVGTDLRVNSPNDKYVYVALYED